MKSLLIASLVLASANVFSGTDYKMECTYTNGSSLSTGGNFAKSREKKVISSSNIKTGFEKEYVTGSGALIKDNGKKLSLKVEIIKNGNSVASGENKVTIEEFEARGSELKVEVANGSSKGECTISAQ